MGKRTDVLTKSYPAKAILAGEYTVLRGSDILALPISSYYGKWKTGHSESPPLDMDLLNYLKEKARSFLSLSKIDDLLDGRFTFESNIPIGCGLGSSGALTAAIYDYTKLGNAPGFDVLQNRLAIMESYFHGKSSGFDPLISLLQKAIRKSSNGKMTFYDPEDMMPLVQNLYLMDSEIPRQSKDLIPQFFNLYRQNKAVIDHLADANIALINAITTKCENPLAALFKEVSSLQLSHMQPMIPHSLVGLWEEGLNSDKFYIKLCGSGGGGYFLVYSHENPEVFFSSRIWPLIYHNS